jgi:hypothetical protein
MQHETANAGDGHASGRACAAHAVRRGIALLSAGAAAIHISTADEHGALFGAAFIAMALFQAAWAARLVQRPSRSLLVAGIAGQLAIVATWAVAHTVGLPFGPGAGQAEAIGRKDLIATGLELLAVLGAIGLLVPASARMLARSSLPAYQPAAGGLVAMALAAVAVATPHGATPHGHGGGHDDAHAATGVAHGHGAGQAHAPGGRGHAHTPADSAGGHEHSSDSRRDHAAHPTLASAHAGGRGEHASLDRHGTGHAGSSGGHGDGDGHAGSGGVASAATGVAASAVTASATTASAATATAGTHRTSTAAGTAPTAHRPRTTTPRAAPARGPDAGRARSRRATAASAGAPR